MYATYDCYNVNLTAGGTLGTVEYNIDTATTEGSVSVKLDGSAASSTGSLKLGPNTLVMTVSKAGYTTRDFTEKIYIQGNLSKASIDFYKESSLTTKLSSSSPEDTSYSSYTTYDVALDKNGNCALYYKTTPANTGSTVKVKENTSELSGSLALGPHTITVTASRQYCASKSFEKKIYVQGILSAPTFTPDGVKVKTEGDTEYWQYSWITYDEMPINITAGNTGNTVKLYMDGHEVEKASLGYGTAGSVSVTQTRQYCKTLESESELMNVSIKPITLKYNNRTGKGKLELKLSNFGDPSLMSLAASVVINDTQIAYRKTSNYDSVNQNTWVTLNDNTEERNVEITLTNPSDVISVFTDIWRANVSDNRTMKQHTSTRTLSQIRSGEGETENAPNGWTFIVDMYAGDYNRCAQPRIQFAVSDD